MQGRTTTSVCGRSSILRSGSERSSTAMPQGREPACKANKGDHVIVTTTPDTDLAAKWNEFLTNARFATQYVTPSYFIDPYVRCKRFAVLAVDGGKNIAAVATGVFDEESIVSGLFSRPQLVFRDGVD